MTNVSALIDVFRMTELNPKTRSKIIIKLGQAINDSFCMNLTELIVYELVSILDPENDILKSEHYLSYIK